MEKQTDQSLEADQQSAAAHLVHLHGAPLRTGALRFGCDDDALGEPVVRLFAAPLGAPDAELPLQLLDDAVLRAVLVHDDGAQLPAQMPLAVHRVHVGGLFGAPDH